MQSNFVLAQRRIYGGGFKRKMYYMCKLDPHLLVLSAREISVSAAKEFIHYHLASASTAFKCLNRYLKMFAIIRLVEYHHHIYFVAAPSVQNVQLAVQHIFPLVHEFRKPVTEKDLNNVNMSAASRQRQLNQIKQMKRRNVSEDSTDTEDDDNDEFDEDMIDYGSDD